MTTTFRNCNELRAAGFTTGERIIHRGYQVRVRDVSGPSSYGYAFAITVSRDRWDWDGKFDLTIGNEFGRASSVHLTDELNMIRQPGCYTSKYFSPSTWENGVAATIRAIDEYYAANPDLAEQQAELDRERAAITERQAQKRLSRAAVRHNRAA